MQEHQQRVIKEQVDLSGNIERLGKFIGGTVFNGLSGDEQGRLREQLDYMKKYDDVLLRRIAAF